MADLAREHVEATEATGTALPSTSVRGVLEATNIDPSADPIETRGAYVRALRERWPELTASAALFVVQQLHP